MWSIYQRDSSELEKNCNLWALSQSHEQKSRLGVSKSSFQLPAPHTRLPPLSCQNSAACIQSRTETGYWMWNIHFCNILGTQNNVLFPSQVQIDNAASKWTSVCSSAGVASQGQAGCKGLTMHVPRCASLKAHSNHHPFLQALSSGTLWFGWPNFVLVKHFPNKSALMWIQNDTSFTANPHGTSKFQNYSQKFYNVFLLGLKERKNLEIHIIQCFSLISWNAPNCSISSCFSVKMHFPFVL